eukprot:4200881-Prorocentrum_lima.AAC.1
MFYVDNVEKKVWSLVDNYHHMEAKLQCMSASLSTVVTLGCLFTDLETPSTGGEAILIRMYLMI